MGFVPKEESIEPREKNRTAVGRVLYVSPETRSHTLHVVIVFASGFPHIIRISKFAHCSPNHTGPSEEISISAGDIIAYEYPGLKVWINGRSCSQVGC